MNKNTQIMLLIMSITTTATIAPQWVSAADITMSPAYIQLDLAQQTHAEITYTNKTDHPIILEFSAKIIDTQQYPKIQFITDPQKKDEGKAHWVQYNKNTITVPSKKSEKIKLSCSNDLPPGGHYAAFIANLKAENETSSTIKTAQTTLQAMLVTPLFIRAKDGRREENIEIKNINTTTIPWQFPKKIQFLITNKGNIESIPYGKINIHGWFSKNIAQGILNEGSNFLLPGSSRKFHAILNNTNQIITPGIYTIKGTIRYSTKSIEINHWFISTGNTNFHWATIATIALGFGIYKGIKKTKKKKTSPQYINIK